MLNNPSQNSSKRETRSFRNFFSNQQISNGPESTQQIQNMALLSMHTSNNQFTQQEQQYSLIDNQTQKSRSKTIQSRPMLQQTLGKQEIIKQLQTRNKTIANEVQNIWEKLQNQVETKKKRQNIIGSEQSYESLQKSLKNAYNWIKIIEKQIQSYQEREKHMIEAVSTMKKKKQELIQKMTISSKLKQEIQHKSNQLKEGEKNIIQISKTQNIGSQLKNKTVELDYWLELVRQTQKKEQAKMNTLKKQYTRIKKLQKDIMATGISSKELEQMKYNCINQITVKKTKLGEQNEQFKVFQRKKQQICDQIMDRSTTHYRQLMNQINLLQKKKEDFSKQSATIQKDKQRIRHKNNATQQKIRQFDLEITTLQIEVPQLRRKHLQRYRSKQRAKSQQVQPNTKNIHKLEKLNTGRKQYQKKNDISNNQKNIVSKSLVFTPCYRKRAITYGKSTSQSIRFNDKYVLAKKNMGKKIVQLIIFFQPKLKFISGLKFLYQEGIIGGDYVWKTSQQKAYKQQTFYCKQGFIRNIFPTFSQWHSGDRLVGIQIACSDGQHHRFGQCQQYQDLNKANQYVSCISGTMNVLVTGDSSSVSLIEELSFDIFQQRQNQ